jgi:phospholipid/cholesterol/gamma-HCH transport system ATP-binding protein
MTNAKLEVKNLNTAYGSRVITRDVSFAVQRGEVFLIIGGSGCGKSTLLKYMIGLKDFQRGKIFYDGVDAASNSKDVCSKFGVLYQNGALWSSMTVAENIALPFLEYTKLSKADVEDIVELKLAFVGLDGFEDFYPSQLSGGMRKRVGLARAMALDPDILFLDEPSSGLDPISAAKFDDLILKIREIFKTTIIAITHDIDSIFNIGDRLIYLDADSKSVAAEGRPSDLRDDLTNAKIANFLSRKYAAPSH